MDRAYYLDCIDEGINHYWRALGKARGMLTRTGDIECTMSARLGPPARIFNVRLRPETAERRIDEIVAEIRAGTLPDSLLIGPRATPGNVVELLARKGFAIETAEPCMAMDLADLRPGPAASAAIRTVTVDDARLLAPWADIVNTDLFGRAILTREQYGDIQALPGARLHLATYEGVPAATCMTLSQGRSSTLEFVATRQAFRNRGLGTAVVLAALGNLRQSGVATVSLRAELMAVGVYKRVGFQEYCPRIVATYDS